MNEYPTNVEQPEIKINKRNPKGLNIFAIIFLFFLASGGVGYGVYMWQKNEARQDKSTLQSQIDSLKKNTELAMEGPKQVVYESKVGGLKLSVPSPYVVIVNVDGNKGGSPGTTLKIGKEDSRGIIQDNIYDGVEIEIGLLSGSLEQNAQRVLNQLKEQGFENSVSVDSKVKDIPAKLITTGMNQNLPRRIYLVKSGDFVYQFTSQSLDNSKDSNILDVVLKGATIEAELFNP